MADQIGSGVVKGLGTGAAIGSAIGPWGTVIGAAAGAIIGGVTGWIQKRKAKRALEEANRMGAVPEDVLATQKMAQRMANEGMPSAQYAQAQQNIQRAQTQALADASDRRGGLLKIGSIQQNVNDAGLALDAESSRQKRANMQYLGQVNNIVGAYKQKRNDRDWNYAMTLMGAANQNLANAADQGASALGYAIGNIGGGNRAQWGSNPRISTPTIAQWGASDAAINRQFGG